MEQMAVGDWVRELQKIEEPKFTVENVLKFCQGHGVAAGSLEPYLHWDPCCYTRNLIFKCPLFEVMTICWERGQVSRIHNHRGQNCWMSASIGKLKVQNFRVEVTDRAKQTCRLIATDTLIMDPQHPTAVNPIEPVHQVLNLPEYNARAASIHIYSLPYESCEVYSADKGTYMDVPLYYTSEYGKVLVTAKGS
ncbi:MAG TPA: cysteine dioxygenase family protein [Candidatus Acidoferrales bacterium]|nr:cysteine dioxygenase family protein [Candidatus Acidoferrales bacterium]